MWIYPTSFINDMVAISVQSSTQTDKLLVGTTANGEAFCQFGSSIVIGNTSLTPSVWTHVLCYIANDKSVVLYVNGAPDASGAFASKPTGQLSVWFGMDGTNVTSPFFGSIDEVALYKTALTWNNVEVIYDQYTFSNRRSPTRSLTPSFTVTKTPTRTSSRTLTPSFTFTPEKMGNYPYPMPVGTATQTPSRTRSITLTPSITPSRSVTPSRTKTPEAVPYPYLVP